MADRVDASITVGGTLSEALFTELIDHIQNEDLGLDWGEPSPESGAIPTGKPLALYAHEVAWGRFDDLETWCRDNTVPFVRWSGSYPGGWGAERVVFNGSGEPRSFAADEEDRILIVRETVERLGSMPAILAYFDEAEFAVPPLVIVTDGATDPPG